MASMLPVFQVFPNEWITFAVFLALIVALLGLSQIAGRKLGWPPETTRKLVHLLVGTLVIMVPFLFNSNHPPTVLAAIFVAVNGIALREKRLIAMHGTRRQTYGTVYFPLAFLILCLFWWDRQITLVISLLLLTFADTAAATVGERAKSAERFVAWSDVKSVQGSITMFLVSVLLVGGGLPLLYRAADLGPLEMELLIPLALFVAALSTIAEALSHAGSDNMSVPLVAAVGTDLFVASAQEGQVLRLLFWVVLSLILAWTAFRLKALTLDGTLGAFVMGVFIFGIGTWKFMIPLSLFLVGSSLLSRIRPHDKGRLEIEGLRKGSQRDLLQVYANGGIPLILAIWWFYSHSPWLYIAYAASIAAANADTWATEIGLLSKSPPRNCVTFRVVDPGTSGGITPLGTAGAAAGSTVVALSSLPFLGFLPAAAAWVALAGFLASLIDSLLGATVQATYRCSNCQKSSELPSHCGRDAMLVRGSRAISNDTVNLICSLAGGAMIYLFSILPATG